MYVDIEKQVLDQFILVGVSHKFIWANPKFIKDYFVLTYT